MVRIHFPPAGSLSHRCLRWQQVQSPAFAGSVSLDVTRERDVLARSRLALAFFLRRALVQSPLGKSKRSTRKAQAGPGRTLCRGLLFS